MRIAGEILDSRVGRRAFALYCLAALLPVAVLWLMTQRALELDLAESERAQRHALAKSYGLTVFERLDTAARIVDRLPDAPASLDVLAPMFQSVHRLDDSHEPRAIGLRAAADHAGPSVRLLVVPVPGAGPPSVVLLRHGLGQGGRAARTAVVLSPDYLWGRTDELPAGVLVCVRDAGQQPLFCPGGHAVDTDAGAESWPLFLNAAFGAQPWSVIVEPDPATAPRPRSKLPTTFGLVAAGTVLLVTLLSLVQIRRTLGPLSQLVDKTREVAAGDYRPLALPPDDEFGVLGAAFDEMGARIDGQLATLRALAEIDRRILAALDLDGIVALVLERARQVEPGVPMAVAHLRTPEAGLVDVYAQAGEGGAVHRRLPCDARLLRRLSRDDAPTGWREPARDDPWRELLVLLGMDVQRVLPLAVRGRLVGAVALGAGADASARLAELRDLGERVAVAVAAKERDDLLVFQARHDALTGLPNRYDAIETLNGALRRAAGGRRLAVLFIDLDRFKAINDGLGHAVGDAVLSEMARQIAAHLPAGGYLARWGGDEFVALLDPAGEPADVAAATAALIAALARPLQVGATELELRCSVGIALYPGDGEAAEELLRNADIAMYRAKQAGRGCYVFFEERMNLEAASRIRLQADLRAAIRDRQLHLEFQPRVDTRDGRIVAAEALARWVHPDEGPVPPALFVRLAEEAGLIEALGEWAVEEACRASPGWRAAGAALRCVSVNVSSRQLRGDAIVRHVRAAMARHGLRPGELEIEMTESVLARDLDEAAVQLEALRAAGATVAVDDFGTGYSSLAYLRRLPVDTIKIDRSFIVDMVDSHAALALVRAIVAMGEALGKQIVAEGVENDEQVAILRSWGCHFVQGYALFPPLGARRLLDELLS